MSQYHSGPCHHILRWHLVEHSPSILNSPTLCIHVNQATPHKNITFKTTLKIYWWTHMLSSITTMFAHIFNTPTKVTKFGCTPSYCIFQNSSNTFLPLVRFHMSQYHGIPSDHILIWHLVQYDLLMIKFALFKIKCNHASTCIQHPYKSNNIWLHILVLRLLK
jgi:hypothetical protein